MASLACASAASAQAFGRWWWDGAIAALGRQADSAVGGVETSRFEQQDLQLSLGLNGYVLHPAIGDFRLGVSFLLSEIESPRSSDQENLGFDAELSLFPRGAYPLRLYARRERFTYGGREVASTSTLGTLPDAITSWGGRFRLRRGPFRGTFVGADYTGLDFLDPGSRTEVQERHFVQWSRGGERASHQLRVQRRLREYATIDLETEELTATFSERVRLSDRTRWNLWGSGVLYESARPEAVFSSDRFAARTQLTRAVRGTDLLDLQISYATFRLDPGVERDAASAAVFYRFRASEAWELAPFVQYLEETANGTSAESPGAGLFVSWGRGYGSWAASVTGRVARSRSRVSAGDADETSRQTSYGLGASLSHGVLAGLLKKLEVQAGRREQNLDQRESVDLPGSPAPPPGIGREDFGRARLTLSHRFDGRWIDGWAEWSRRESASELDLGDFVVETRSGALQAGSARVGLLVNLGESLQQQPELGEQEVRFLGATLNVAPMRLVRIEGSYATNTRSLVLGPDLDGERLEVRLQLRVGAFVISLRGYEGTQEVAGGTETENSGFLWSISRNFTGWLPIVTGDKRRGMIR